MSGVRRRGGSCRRFPNLLEDSSEDEDCSSTAESIELDVLSSSGTRSRPDSGYFSLVNDKRRNIPNSSNSSTPTTSRAKFAANSSSESDDDSIGPTVAPWYRRGSDSTMTSQSSQDDDYDPDEDFDTFTNVRWRDFFRRQRFNQPNELLDNRDLFSCNFEDILESAAFKRRLSDFEQYVGDQKSTGSCGGFTDSAEFWDNGSGLMSSNHIYNCEECRPRPPPEMAGVQCLCGAPDCKYTCHHRCRQQVRLDCEPGPSAYSATLPYSHSNHLSNNHSNHYTPIAHIPTPFVNGRRDDGLAAIPALVANGDLNRDLDHDSAVHSSRHHRRHSASASSPVQEAPPLLPPGAPVPPSAAPAPPSPSPPPSPKSPSTPTPLSDSCPPSLQPHHQNSEIMDSNTFAEASSSPSRESRITAVGSSHTINGGVSASEVEVVLISPYATAPLRQRLDMYNRRVTKQPDTLHLTDADTFQGFIRVTLNLSRPINMSVGARPPSIYDLLAHQEGAPPPPENAPPRLETMSFYIPKDTIKSLHISSKTTAGEVITELLHKFSITDSPRKFALYEQYRDPETKQLKIRKLSDKERPLDLWLAWQEVGEERKFLLQENETGDIMWEAFSIPELQNFLRILQREEEEHISQIKTKFKLMKLQLNVKMRDAQEYEQAQGKLEFTEEGSTPTQKANESFA